MTLPRFSSRSDKLIVKLPPIADFDYVVEAGGKVRFFDRAVDPDGTIERRLWNFGETPSVDFSYVSTAPPSYEIAFTSLAADAGGGSIVRHLWTFGDVTSPRPTASFTYSKNALTVTFTNTSFAAPGKTISSYAWTFGDGTTSNVASPVKVYPASGSYTVTLKVTDNSGIESLVASQQVVVGATGRPFGVFNYFTGATSYETIGTEDMNLSHTWDDPGTIVARIRAARALGVKLILVMTAGHAPYITNGSFDFDKWKARMNLFNTAAIKAEVNAGLQDGTVLGAAMVDEPNFRDWGGWFTKPRLDLLADHLHSIFPALPAGVVIVHWWREHEIYQKVDFIVSQYDWWQSPHGPGGGMSGLIDPWITAALEIAAQNGIKIMFSMNVINGGIQDLTEPISWTCPVGNTMTTTNGQGMRFPVCQMNPIQVETWGKKLIENGQALLMWKYYSDHASDPRFQEVYRNIRLHGDLQPAPNLKRAA
jgi:PKD repeat protein